MPIDWISTAYAATVALGGVMGYVKAKSTASLAAGLIFGSVLGMQFFYSILIIQKIIETLKFTKF